jgi:hypothetical protein
VAAAPCTCEDARRACFYSRGGFLHSRRSARCQRRGTAVGPRQARSAEGNATDRWTRRRARQAVSAGAARGKEGRACVFLGDRREGDRTAPASGWWGRVCTDAEAGEARCVRRRAMLGRAPVVLSSAARTGCQLVNPTLIASFYKNLKDATKTLDTKVVDETPLYNICKCRHMFW